MTCFKFALLPLCILALGSCSQPGNQVQTAPDHKPALSSNQAADEVDAALRHLGVEHLSFNLDYHAMEMRLKTAPGRDFFSALERNGWRRSSNAGRADIYFKDGMWLMYIPSRRSVLYSPPEN